MFENSVGQLSSLLVRVVHHATLQGKPITFASALAPATTPWIAMWLANMSFTRSYTM